MAVKKRSNKKIKNVKQLKRTPVKKTSSIIKNWNQLNYGLATSIHLFVCIFLPMIYIFIQKFVDFKIFTITGSINREFYTFFNFSFLPYIAFACLYILIKAFSSKTNYNFGRIFKNYSFCTIVFSFILAVILNQSIGSQGFVVDFVWLIFLTFLPALVSAYIYSHAVAKVEKISHRLDQV